MISMETLTINLRNFFSAMNALSFKSFRNLMFTFTWKSSFPRTVYLHLTWPNVEVEAKNSEVADDANYTLQVSGM